MAGSESRSSGTAERSGGSGQTEPGGTRQLWQSLWACVLRLERELGEDPRELCWQRPQAAPPPLRLLSRDEPEEGVEVSPSQAPAARRLRTEQAPTETAVPEKNAENAENAENALQSVEAPVPAGGIGSEPEKGTLAAWQQAVLSCQACPLGQPETRIRQQPIVGYPARHLTEPQRIEVLVVCDVPDFEADRHGRPLAPGDLEYLQKWLEAIQISAICYLTNLVKCRTPGGRAAWPEELKSCAGHLQQQLRFFQPKAILALGSSAARSLSRQRCCLDTLRSQELFYPLEGGQIPLFATYSVAEVLQNPDELRAPVWRDLKRLRAALPSAGPGRLQVPQGSQR